jgi:heterodisulfide reductase subunit A-like polyferredoxin
VDVVHQFLNEIERSIFQTQTFRLAVMAETNDPQFSSIADRCVDTVRPLKVVIVGAGISGILAAIKLQESIRKLELIIYEKNEGLGGTWLENRYPGCACGMFSSPHYQVLYLN